MGLGDFFPEEGGEEEGGSGSSPLHSQGSNSDKPGKRANPGRKNLCLVSVFFCKGTFTHSIFAENVHKTGPCVSVS